MNARSLAALIAKDLKLYFSNSLFAVVTVIALAAYIALYYLMPNRVDETLELGLYISDIPPAMQEMLEDEEVKFFRAGSEEELRQAVLAGDVPAGYAFPEDALAQMASGRRVTAQLYLSHELPPDFHGVYEVILHEFAYAISGQTLDIETTDVTLGRDMAGEQVPPRRKMLPLLTAFVLLVECLGLASLISAEVEAGTIRALMVTPLTMAGLFVGKGIFGTLFAFVQAALLLLVTGGLEREPLVMLAALLLGAAFVTGVAFLIAALGRDLMSVMGWGVLAIPLLVLPTLTILIPGLATNWIKLIPSHYLVDTIYRVSSFGATWAEVAPNLAALAAYAAAFMALGVVVLRRKFR